MSEFFCDSLPPISTESCGGDDPSAISTGVYLIPENALLAASTNSSSSAPAAEVTNAAHAGDVRQAKNIESWITTPPSAQSLADRVHTCGCGLVSTDATHCDRCHHQRFNYGGNEQRLQQSSLGSAHFYPAAADSGGNARGCKNQVDGDCSGGHRHDHDEGDSAPRLLEQIIKPVSGQASNVLPTPASVPSEAISLNISRSLAVCSNGHGVIDDVGQTDTAEDTADTIAGRTTITPATAHNSSASSNIPVNGDGGGNNVNSVDGVVEITIVADLLKCDSDDDIQRQRVAGQTKSVRVTVATSAEPSSGPSAASVASTPSSGADDEEDALPPLVVHAETKKFELTPLCHGVQPSSGAAVAAANATVIAETVSTISEQQGSGCQDYRTVSENVADPHATRDNDHSSAFIFFAGDKESSTTKEPQINSDEPNKLSLDNWQKQQHGKQQNQQEEELRDSLMAGDVARDPQTPEAQLGSPLAGLELAQTLRETKPPSPASVLTAHGTSVLSPVCSLNDHSVSRFACVAAICDSPASDMSRLAAVDSVPPLPGGADVDLDGLTATATAASIIAGAEPVDAPVACLVPSASPLPPSPPPPPGSPVLAITSPVRLVNENSEQKRKSVPNDGEQNAFAAYAHAGLHREACDEDHKDDLKDGEQHACAANVEAESGRAQLGHDSGLSPPQTVPVEDSVDLWPIRVPASIGDSSTGAEIRISAKWVASAERDGRGDECCVADRSPRRSAACSPDSDTRSNLEDLEGLNVNLGSIKSRFEQKVSGDGSVKKSQPAADGGALSRSASVLKRLEGYQSVVAGEAKADSTDEEGDAEDEMDKIDLSKKIEVCREMGELKKAWESGDVSRGLVEPAKDELASLRKKICLGRSESMKVVYEKAVQNANTKDVKKSTAPEDVGVTHAFTNTLKKKFETGEVIKEQEAERLEAVKSEKEEDLSVCQETGIAHQAKNMFKQLDKEIASRPLTNTLPSSKLNSEIRRARSSIDDSSKNIEVVKASHPGQKEHIEVETVALSERFKFFENYKEGPTSANKKEFRITPPRDCDSGEKENSPAPLCERDPNVVVGSTVIDDIPKVDTATKMRQKFQQLCESESAGQQNGPDSLGSQRGTPRPPKRITSPRELFDTNVVENQPVIDPDVIKCSYKVDDDIQVEADKAKVMRARFENWTDLANESSTGRKPSVGVEDECLPIDNITRNMKAMFEANATSNCSGTPGSGAGAGATFRAGSGNGTMNSNGTPPTRFLHSGQQLQATVAVSASGAAVNGNAAVSSRPKVNRFV